VIELLVFALVATLVVAVVGAVAAVFGFVVWMVLLPFRVVGLAIKGVLFLFTLPLLLVFGALALVFGGFGFAFLVVPMLPFLLIVAFVAWLVRRNRPRPIVTPAG
jgi:hypothetical protein